MKFKKIIFAMLIAIPLSASIAHAQSWPSKPVRIIVPFAAGGASDTQGRLLARSFSETFKRQFVVENRTGAAGAIGAEFVVRAPADGYTLLFTTAALSVNAALYGAKQKFDPTKDLAPVIWASSVPLVLNTHPSVPVRSVKELVNLSKRHKSGLNGGHHGSGATNQIAIEMLIQQTGANIVQVPYKGGTPSTIALLSGEVDFVFSTMTTVVPYLQSGRLRGLAVSTKKRSSIFPEMPTMDSIYPGFESDNWFGMFAPAGTPKEIISRLHASATEAMKSAEFRNLIAQAGGDVAGGPPEELGLHLQSEIARYSTVIKTGNIQVQ